MVSEIFNGECDAMVDMTLNNHKTKVDVIDFNTNRFLYATSYRLSIVTFSLARTPRLATIHTLQTDNRQTQ